MKTIQYFNFKNSLAALNFYEQHLGAANIHRVGGDDGRFNEMPEEYQVDGDFTMHATFEILGQTFYRTHTWKNKKIANSGAIVTFFENAINGGCVATMELGQTEWSPLYGMFNDPFGVTWMISAEE